MVSWLFPSLLLGETSWRISRLMTIHIVCRWWLFRWLLVTPLLFLTTLWLRLLRLLTCRLLTLIGMLSAKAIGVQITCHVLSLVLGIIQVLRVRILRIMSPSCTMSLLIWMTSSRYTTTMLILPRMRSFLRMRSWARRWWSSSVCTWSISSLITLTLTTTLASLSTLSWAVSMVTSLPRVQLTLMVTPSRVRRLPRRLSAVSPWFA